jgi:VWFA-related protein
MMRVAAALIVGGSLFVVPHAAAPAQLTTGADLVEVDAVVVDGKGRPIPGLLQSDFTIREDGKAVDITTFAEITGPVRDDPDTARTLVLLLDDTGVSPIGTQTIQTIARAFVSGAADTDDVSVVRLHARADEPFGDRLLAESRIQAYRGGAWPFVSWSTTQEVLDKVSEISKLVAANTSRRKVLVCVGSPYICNIQEPQSNAPRQFETSWTAAISEAAHANVAVYALVPGRAPLRAGGLPEVTGGELFASSYDVGPPIDRILRDAGTYYVLGYWPVAASRGLHKVDVKVDRRGAHVHARKLR